MMHQDTKSRRISTNMNQDTEVCNRILKSVICRVEQFEVTRSHRKSIAYKTISIVAVIALIPIIYFILQSSSQSGFREYLSLVFSDGAYMIQNWKEFLLSTASSLPIVGGIMTLLVLFILTTAIQKNVENSIYSDNVRLRLSADSK